MHHMEGCENVFSASWSEKGKPAPALLVPAIRESVNKILQSKTTLYLGKNKFIVYFVTNFLLINDLLCHTLSYGCEVTGLHQRRQTGLLPKSKKQMF